MAFSLNSRAMRRLSSVWSVSTNVGLFCSVTMLVRTLCRRQALLVRLHRWHRDQIELYFSEISNHASRPTRIYGYVVLISLHYLLLYWFEPDRHSIWIYLDIIKLFGLKNVVLLLIVGCIVNFTYWHWLLYNRSQLSGIILVCRQVLLEHRVRFFLPPYRFGNHSIVHSFRLFSFTIWIVLHVIHRGTELFLLMAFFYVLNLVVYTEHWQVPLLLLLFSFTIFWFTFQWFLNVSIMMGNIGFNIMLIFYVKIWQLKELIEKNDCTVAKLMHYCNHQWQMPSFTAQVNRIYGAAILTFLLIQCPINCYLVIMVLTANLHISVTLLLTLFLLEQLVVLVCTHWMIAVLNQQFSRSTLYLPSHLLRQPVSLLFRFQLHLSLHFQAFHTSPGYGISYGQMGLISLLSFVKFIIIYSEVLMYAYKLIKNL